MYISPTTFQNISPPVWQLCLKYLPHLFPLFSSFPSLSPELPPMRILSYAASHLHEGTGKLRKTCAHTVGHLTESVPSLTVSEKWPPAQRFDVQAADRRSPIQVLTQRKAALTWVIAWHRTPTTHRTLSVQNISTSIYNKKKVKNNILQYLKDS